MTIKEVGDQKASTLAGGVSPADFTHVFQRIEDALFGSPYIQRIHGCMGEPAVAFSRDGVTIKIKVAVKGRHNPCEMWVYGESLAEALEDLTKQVPFFGMAHKGRNVK